MKAEKKRRFTASRLLVACMLVCSYFAGLACCGCSEAGGSTAAATGAEFTPAEKVLMPQVDDFCPAIDVSGAADGYFVARMASDTRLKFQVSKDEAVYNYDLPSDGRATVFPVNLGDGAYTLRIMKNTEGNNYVEVENEEVNVELTSEFAPFLIPNQYCDYNEKSACVAKARELTADARNQGEAVRDICDFVKDNVAYDMEKAERLSTETGYIPNPDETLATGKGVCFDYASLGAAMLRCLGLPAKIVTGYVSPGNLYHAWILVYIDGTWQSAEFSVSPDTWSRVDLTFAASGASEFVGDGTSYTERYVY